MNAGYKKVVQRVLRAMFCAAVVVLGAASYAAAAGEFQVLKPETYASQIQYFNKMEDENWTNYVSNAESWKWLEANIPLFDCPDADTEQMYYFRWWSFRKHLVKTPAGYVFTEFLTPVGHAGAFNTISCATSFHIEEGRWLRDGKYLDDYTLFWLRGNEGKPEAHFHKYSEWFDVAVYERYLVNRDKKFVAGMLKDLTADYEGWEKEKLMPNGLFWQFDVRDGMEESISGSRKLKNIRPTLNSYMYGNARAMASIARLAGKEQVAAEYDHKADILKRLSQSAMWDDSAKFYKVRLEDGKLSDAREELGYIPWCFELPDKGHEEGWSQLTDWNGFRAPYGVTTAERRHPLFRSHGCCHCEWDGAVWPFATCQTLNALANVLRDYPQAGVSCRDYFDVFQTYVRSQHADGHPYIGEYLDETTGEWFNGRGGRSRYYNHSSFADIVITGLVGLRPRADDTVELSPLLPQGTWDWFCLDGVRYHGRDLSIIWDKTGDHYKRGKGLMVLADGNVFARADDLGKLSAKMP